MLDNGLDISLQGHKFHIGSQRQTLSVKNYFFVHRWKNRSVTYTPFTLKELSRIHKWFGHLSARTAHELIKRASQEMNEKRSQQDPIGLQNVKTQRDRTHKIQSYP